MNASHATAVLAAACALSALVNVAPASPAGSKDDPTVAPEFESPAIADHGEVVPLPKALFQLDPGSRVVFDVSGGGSPQGVVPALDRVAALVNLAAVSKVDVEAVVVLHGDAAQAALADAAYAARTGASKNPNLPLLRALRDHGVRTFVCGQSLAHNRWSARQVAEPVELAVSAMTAVVALQRDGFAVLVSP